MSSENYRIENQHSVYFLTFTVTDWVDVFTRLNYRNIIVDSLEYCKKNKGLKLFAWCLMTNHIHIVCTTEIPFMMSDFVRDFKKFTANAVIKDIQNMPESRRDWMLYRFEFAGKYDNRITKYRFWQDKSHPVELTSTEMINQRINYTHENPVSQNEYEIICVNDGSTDNSLDIIKKYEKESQNVKVIDQENRGHSAARNVGLNAAIGKYVWFVDSDDIVDGNSMLSIISTIEIEKIDFLTIGLCNVSDDAHYISNKATHIYFKKQPRNFACSGNRIILRDILTQNNIIWSTEVYSLDDVLFLFYVQLYAKKAAYTESVYYYHRENPNSITRTKNKQNTIKHINGLKNLIEKYQQELIKLEDRNAKSSVINNVKDRVSLGVKSILFEAILIYNSQERIKLLQELKVNKLYPYKLITYDLIPKVSLKRTLMDWSMLLFPISFYYLSYSFILEIFLSLRKSK